MPNKSTVSIEEAQLMELIRSWEKSASKIREKGTDATQYQLGTGSTFSFSAAQVRKLIEEQQQKLDAQERKNVEDSTRRDATFLIENGILFVAVFSVVSLLWAINELRLDTLTLVAFLILYIKALISWKRHDKDVLLPIISGIAGLLLFFFSMYVPADITYGLIEDSSISQQLLGEVSSEMMGAAFLAIMILFIARRVKSAETGYMVFVFILGLAFALVFDGGNLYELISTIGSELLGASIAILLVEHVLEKKTY